MINQKNNTTIALFHQESETLSSTDGKNSIHLGTYATRCLDLLLLREGEFVTNDEILTYCWRELGIEVSTASVRQTIALLRKAFASLDIDKKVLVNIPGEGYALTGGRISRKIASEPPTAVQLPDPAVANPLAVKRWAVLPKRRTFLLITLCLTSLLISLTLVWYRQHTLLTDVDYQYQRKEGDLLIYSQRGYRPPDNILQRLQAYQQQNYITLPAAGHLYINSVWQEENLAVILCNKLIDDPTAHCQSIIVTGETP